MSAGDGGFAVTMGDGAGVETETARRLRIGPDALILGPAAGALWPGLKPDRAARQTVGPKKVSPVPSTNPAEKTSQRGKYVRFVL
jgi:hypothetical protein